MTTASHVLWAAQRLDKDYFRSKEIAEELDADVSAKWVGNKMHRLEENGLVEPWTTKSSTATWTLTD